jgi:hypothetical protein
MDGVSIVGARRPSAGSSLTGADPDFSKVDPANVAFKGFELLSRSAVL